MHDQVCKCIISMIAQLLASRAQRERKKCSSSFFHKVIRASKSRQISKRLGRALLKCFFCNAAIQCIDKKSMHDVEMRSLLYYTLRNNGLLNMRNEIHVGHTYIQGEA